MKANRTFINARNERVNKGDPVKQSDYDKPTWDQYLKKGLVSAPEKKPAKPKNKKSKK